MNLEILNLIEPIATPVTDREWKRYDRTVDAFRDAEVRDALKREARLRAYWENRCARAEGVGE